MKISASALEDLASMIMDAVLDDERILTASIEIASNALGFADLPDDDETHERLSAARMSVIHAALLAAARPVELDV